MDCARADLTPTPARRTEKPIAVQEILPNCMAILLLISILLSGN
jgi:hypothetical protein